MSFTDLSLGHRESALIDSSLQPARLTTEARAQIPAGPSNISAYLHRNETSEDIALGYATIRNEESMAKDLAAWEAYWKTLCGK
jgi:hypothetical protein